MAMYTGRIGRQAFTTAVIVLGVGGVVLALAPSARAQWKLASSDTLPSPADGVTHTCQNVQDGVDGLLGPRKATLNVVRFDSRRHTFRVLDQTSLGRENLGQVMQKYRCLAGVNGGYFQPDFEPVGLLLSDGKLIHKPQHSPHLLTGALVVTHNHIAIRRTTEPLPGRDAKQAVQAGPFLVEDGKTVPGLNASRSARRTAVVTDGDGGWGLVSSTPVTLDEFSQILASPALMPGNMKIRRALNFDGGSSTALWVRQPGTEMPFYLNEYGIVRDFVAIVPRQEVDGKKSTPALP